MDDQKIIFDFLPDLQVLTPAGVKEVHVKKEDKNVIFFFEGPDGQVLLDPRQIKIASAVEPWRFVNINLLKELLDSGSSKDLIKLDSWSLFQEVRNHILYHIDMEKYYSTVAALWVFQSWVQEALNSVFYLQVKAPFGGGKTTCGETLIELSRNGISGSNFSVAVLARVIHYMHSPVFYDEIDQKEKEERDEVLRILRAGQRRDAASYVRMVDKNDIQFFNVFSPKIFSVHSEIEEALAQRSVPIILHKTKRPEIPIRNQKRREKVPPIYTKLMAWRYTEGLEVMNMLRNTTLYYDEEKKRFFFEDEDPDAVWQLPVADFLTIAVHKYHISGRNLELLQNMALLAGAMGILEFIADDLMLVMLKKEEEDLLQNEKDYKVIFRDVAVDIYRKLRMYYLTGSSQEIDGDINDFITAKGYFMFPMDTLRAIYRRKLKEEGFNVLSDRKIAGMLRDLGIFEFTTIKQRVPKVDYSAGQLVAGSTKSVRRVIVYTKPVLVALGIPKEEWHLPNEEVKEGGGENEGD